MSTSAVTPPPGYELERGEELAVQPPPGFELEDGVAGRRSIQAPPGFELEHSTESTQAGSAQRRTPLVDSSGLALTSQTVAVPQTNAIKPAQPKRKASVTRASEAQTVGVTPVYNSKSDSDAETLKFFNEGLAKFSDSSAQNSDQNLPEYLKSQIHSGDRSWANGLLERIPRLGGQASGSGNVPSGRTSATGGRDTQGPGAVSRFTSSAGQVMGVPPKMSDYWEGPKMAVTHPVESAKLLYESANEAQQSVVDKAYFYQHQPGFANKAKGFAYGIYSSLPFVGPSFAHAGEQFENRDFAGGFGTMTGLVLPSMIGGKSGGFREPNFRIRPSFKTGDAVVLSNRKLGTVQDTFPEMGVLRVQTQQGPRTVRASEVESAAPISQGLISGPSTHLPPAAIKTGDAVTLTNGRRATVEQVFPQLVAARVRSTDGKTSTVRLSQIEQHATQQSAQLSKAHSPHPVQKPEPSLARAKVWSDSLARQPARGSGAARDFQVRTCGPEEFLIEGGGEEIWADGIDAAAGLIRESKHVGKPKISPYIKESAIRSDVRRFMAGDIEDEFRRYGRIIADPNTPVRALEVITNDPKAVPYFLDLMKQNGVPGWVVLK
ncbi:MAG TPA: restriction endonuclease fold toxin-2 domain-containing protein [Candidatus Angelobacter sp.]